METVNFPDVVSAAIASRPKPIKSAEHQKPYPPAQFVSALRETIHPGTIRPHATFSDGFWLWPRDSYLNLPVRLLHQSLGRVDTSRCHRAAQRWVLISLLSNFFLLSVKGNRTSKQKHMLGRIPAPRPLDILQRLKAHSVQLLFRPGSRYDVHKRRLFTLQLMSNCLNETENILCLLVSFFFFF